MNKVQLEGRLGNDPAIKFAPSGVKIANASLSTSNNYKGKEGQYVKKPVSWHSLVAFGEPAGVLESCRKGDDVRAEGKIQYEKWTDQSGMTRTGTKILCFLIEKKT